MKKILRLFLCLALCAMTLVSCQNQTVEEKISEQEVEKKTVYSHSSLIGVTLSEMTEDANIIVHGQIINQGDAYLHPIYSVDGDHVFDLVYTPMTIEVMDCLKGDIGDTVIYNFFGGETDSMVFIADDETEVSVGDEILIFLNDSNCTWGYQGVYIIEDGNTMVENRMLPTTLYSDDNQNRYSEISLTDLESLVLAYIGE